MSKNVPELLSIQELADRAGLSAATLRAWEHRHGFPEPQRLPSGHRRYTATDAALVREVVRRRDSGRRLDVAINEAIADARRQSAPRSGSVYAELRRLHPTVAAHRLRKSTLRGLSWAIEDEFCARALAPVLLGAFQRAEFYDAARCRWRELGRVARRSVVLADFGPGHDPGGPPTEVDLRADSPMLREWTVVCDSPDLTAALAAWELPGQDDTPDRDRLFESVWSVDPVVVRTASRAFTRVAEHSGWAEAPDLLEELAQDAGPRSVDLGVVTQLFNRVVAYVDAAGD